MTEFLQPVTTKLEKLYIGIAWCLAWGDKRQPQFDLSVLQQMRQALNSGQEEPKEVRSLVDEVRELQAIDEQENSFPDFIKDLEAKYPQLWKQPTKIGLVYGGATNIKKYVFEGAKIQEIRGASALLERINSVDIPSFFGKIYSQKSSLYCRKIKGWLDRDFPMTENSPRLSDALISELIIYSTGGNILAFCPAAFVDDLANAIERRYTEETLTANSCAVGDTFKLLEIRFGLLKDPLEETLWLDWYRQEYQNPLVKAYFGKLDKEQEELCNRQAESIKEAFADRKSFNELVTKLTIQFNQRRSGNDWSDRPTRRYPPMFETHPYLVRDGSDRRSAVGQANDLPGEPWFSESTARKRLVGNRAKKDAERLPEWYNNIGLDWHWGFIESWAEKFEAFLERNPQYKQKYYAGVRPQDVNIAQRLTHVGNASKDFVAYIYADGNNFGGFIQKIRTPTAYQEFSEDTAKAIECAVYQSLAENLHPHELKGITDPESSLEDGDLVHPFEIITIGGDDVLLVVPANRALQIAQMIAEQLEKILLKEVTLVEHEIQDKDKYRLPPPKQLVDISKCHRYRSQEAKLSQCKLSLSIGA